MPVPAAAAEGMGELASRAAALAAASGGNLLECFAAVPDPRDPRGIRHSLPCVLALCTAAVLCGHTAIEDVTAWPGVLTGCSWRPVGLSRRLEACRLSEGYVSIGFMSHLPISGEQPVVPLPDREPAAIRAAVARLDPAALARFEADWTAATARARDEYSLLPARYFVEHWFNWVAVARWPELATRLRACERIVAESPDRAERRAAAAEISRILRQAETISA